MTYTFDDFLSALETNWYDDDAALRSLLQQYAPSQSEATHRALSDWGKRTAGELRRLAEEAAQPHNHPQLRKFDAYNHRVDEIVLPAATTQALSETCGREHLGAEHGNAFVFYAKIYLYAQNGEAGVCCPLACTDGLVRALEHCGDRTEHQEAVDLVRGSTPDRYYHGAQFVTEIQGGSDVAANALEAMPDGDCYRLRGAKWFCSNINADFFLVTARPTGAPPDGRGVALFLVPAYNAPDSRVRNGYTIDRLKDKLGTRELATAEVTFRDAMAYPVGPLDRGIANLLRYVLTPSRFACINFAAAALRRSERIAHAYCDFRQTFGRKLSEYDAVRATLDDIRRARVETLASVFELLRLWQCADEAAANSQHAIDFRIMLSLAKAVLTRRATELVREAMMLLGGNGVEERFTPLPRIFRDAFIMETWEGPHNVLFAQAYDDMLRFELDAKDFVNSVAGEPLSDLARRLEGDLSSGVAANVPKQFADTGRALVGAFARRAADEALAQKYVANES